MTRPGRRDERGTIVIEAMVAVLIVAAMAGALFETVQARSTGSRALAERRLALLVAQSRLAAADLRASEVPGTIDGSDGRFAWRLRAEPFRADEASAAGVLALVTVSVGEADAPDRPLAQLRTLRLVR